MPVSASGGQASVTFGQPVGEKITSALRAVIAADILLRLREYVRLSYSGLG